MSPNLDLYKDMQALLAKMNTNELQNGGSRYYLPCVEKLMTTVAYFRMFVLTPEERKMIESK